MLMSDTAFHSLSAGDQKDALQVAASASGRPAYLLEKDVWVVQLLQTLFATRYGGDLTFKGGTSLSKAYDAIRRFSEDVDVTYDIRAIAPDLVSESGEDPLPPSRNQAGMWTREIKERLTRWVGEELAPAVETGLEELGLSAQLRAEEDKLFVAYEPLFNSYGFVRAEVSLEFGGRSTGAPRENRLIKCDAATHILEVSFPTAQPLVMLAERTFWEKATAIHVYCLQRRMRGERQSRHWHDLVRLDEAGYAETALADRSLALAVARHKSMFFRENDADRNRIDYEATVMGGLRLVPDGDAYRILADDYDKMVGAGMLLDEGESFNDLMEKCSVLEKKANRGGTD